MATLPTFNWQSRPFGTRCFAALNAAADPTLREGKAESATEAIPRKKIQTASNPKTKE
ncbi:MAG: hypothetical protein GF349_00750 [Candidatus Magasanikbacteria bacterium]|nr:hypothetical protein [Candidatus Magasanikbacteria bacterium]